MLTSDGLTRETFLPLWREAMWSNVELDDRVRLVLELGRLLVREQGQADTLLVSFAAGADAPIEILPLPMLPRRDQPTSREGLSERLTLGGVSEVFLLTTQIIGGPGSVRSHLLVAWGESREGGEACWILPYRGAREGLQEAAPMGVPSPEATEISRLCRGLLPRDH